MQFEITVTIDPVVPFPRIDGHVLYHPSHMYNKTDRANVRLHFRFFKIISALYCCHEELHNDKTIVL